MRRGHQCPRRQEALREMFFGADRLREARIRSQEKVGPPAEPPPGRVHQRRRGRYLMTPEQLQALRDALIAGKVPDEKTSPDRAFLRGWNEGVAFAEMQIEK